MWQKASAWVKNNRDDLAIRDYEKLLNITPDDVQSRYMRGCCYERTGDVDAAIKDYTGVIERDTQHAHAMFALAACHNRKGNFAQFFKLVISCLLGPWA